MALDRDSSQSLEDYKIDGPLPSMYYLADFITKEEEAELLRQVYAAPLPQWRTLTHRRLQSLPSPLSKNNVLLDSPLPAWLSKPIDRLKEIPIARADLSNSARDSLRENKEAVQHVFFDSPHRGPNHCLVNEYLPGQGIMPHEDGPAYHPITATISLGSHAVLKVGRKPGDDASTAADTNQREWSILCERRSLLITTESAYSNTLHGIESIDEDAICASDNGTEGSFVPPVANWSLLSEKEAWMMGKGVKKRETRVSLTYRDVLKVKSLKTLKSLNLGGRR